MHRLLVIKLLKNFDCCLCRLLLGIVPWQCLINLDFPLKHLRSIQSIKIPAD